MQVLTPEKSAEIRGSIERDLAEAVRFAEESPFPDPGEITDDVYTT
jgi:pyruvate dehydrogenase E1 component alpha subunit